MFFGFPVKIKTCDTHIKFCKQFKLYQVLRYMYANTLQLHPCAFNLWIDAASFEFFESGGNGNIEKDRALIQRAISLNPQLKELWLQCFAIDLYFWTKLVGRAIVLKLKPQPNLSKLAQIVLRNTIKVIPDSVNFRLELLRICELFPFDSVKEIEDGLNDGIFNNLKNNVDAWILQAEYTMQARVRNNINIQGKKFKPPILSSILIIHKATRQNSTTKIFKSDLSSCTS